MSVSDLEARVTRLEQDRSVEAGLRAQSFGLSLVHADTGALRQDMTEVKDRLGRLKTDVSELKTDVAEIKSVLQALVTRLDRDSPS